MKKFYFLIVFTALFFLGFFCTQISHAEAATLYFNAGTSDDWSTLAGNWWTDAGFTSPASGLPGTSDDVIITQAVSSNSGDDASVSRMIVNNDGIIGIPVTVANGATFSGPASFNSSTITGDAVFNDSSYNQGTITGNATFNGSLTTNYGSVSGNGIFYDLSVNSGSISGDACFASTADPDGGTVGGSTTVCPVIAPTVVTSPASSVTPSQGVLQGNIISTGGEDATERGFEYGTSDSYGSTITQSRGPYISGAFDEHLIHLDCATTYYFRAFATNGVGTTYGDGTSFTTLPCGSDIIDWNEIRPKGDTNVNWASLAASADGSHIIVADAPGRIYTSSDGGDTWTERMPAGNSNRDWAYVTVSGDGSLFMAGEQEGRLYVSTNSGTDWTETQPAGDVDGTWFALASDSDGSNLVAGDNDGGRLYVSTNSGTDWTETQPAGDVDGTWQSVASDSDGSNLIAASQGGRLYISSNSGTDWTETQPIGDADNAWHFVASDADGSNLFAGTAQPDGHFYVSSNGGADWVAYDPHVGFDDEWYYLASDSDGSTLVAASILDGNGRIYVSSNGGLDWTETRPAGNMGLDYAGVAVSSDGSVFWAVHDGGRVYKGSPHVSVVPPPTPVSGHSHHTSSHAPIPLPVLPVIVPPVPVIIVPSLPAPNPVCVVTAFLKFGSRGDQVKCLQIVLKANPPLVPDGIFGKKTKAAVVNFQKLYNLVQDGIVGPKTRKALSGSI